ncbi:hypothetical protein [Chitinophaga ginsengisoli]|uniref:Uncharacterized protein n=1 Tax=Chitinophaga ginsengisoli TaxID=363837 RepID=A0A2P8GKI8_9BACT|nr:hypothetical protein [Chitinophaga ginsengisoli]PSL34455.1 hypothetical protein CLV42_10226 [Chitinophaga ginsengisoli]
MKMIRGIRLHNQTADGHTIVSINTGVLHHAGQEKQAVNYEGLSFVPGFEEGAFLPKKNWRSLNSTELNILKPVGKHDIGKTICIGEIPDELKTLFEQLHLDTCRNREDVFARFREHPTITTAINTLTDQFLQSKSNGHPYKFHYLGTNLPDLEVTACDTTVMRTGYTEQDKKYMGIHNDGTEYVSPYQLHKLGNRLTINLGREPRSFLFLNLTMVQALNKLKQVIDVDEHKIDIINIADYFFKYFPDYPVVKITQHPYQYYIAPTDNCFHDGSTLGMKSLDIILVYFGMFTCKM